MKATTFLAKIKTKVGVTISSFLSTIAAGGGSASAVCQTTCSTSSGILPLLGVSLAATPFAFLAEYQKVIWQIAFVFFLFLLIFYLRRSNSISRTDTALLLINGGLLTIGIPFFRNFTFSSFFPFIGLTILGIGLYLFFIRKPIKIVFN